MEVSETAENGEVIAVEVAGAFYWSLPQAGGLLEVEEWEDPGEKRW